MLRVQHSELKRSTSTNGPATDKINSKLSWNSLALKMCCLCKVDNLIWLQHKFRNSELNFNAVFIHLELLKMNILFVPEYDYDTEYTLPSNGPPPIKEPPLKGSGTSIMGRKFSFVLHVNILLLVLCVYLRWILFLNLDQSLR